MAHGYADQIQVMDFLSLALETRSDICFLGRIFPIINQILNPLLHT